MPILLNQLARRPAGRRIAYGDETLQLTCMIIGALIILFLIAELHGLARLWQIAKEKLRSGRSRMGSAICEAGFWRCPRAGSIDM